MQPSIENMQENRWLTIAADLGVRVVAPFTTLLDGAEVSFAALFPQFGLSAGMIVDQDWSALKPRIEALLAAGFGFSCMSFNGTDHDGMRSARRLDLERRN